MPRSSQSRPQCAQIADHLAQNTPNSLNFTEVVCTLGASIPNTANMETAARPTGIAKASVGGGRAWPDIGNDAPIRIIHHNPTGVEGAGGSGGPGRASRRGAERSEVAQPRGRPDPPAPGTPAGPSCASCGRRQGLARQRDDAPNHTSTTCPTGMEGTGGTGGHGQPDPKAPGTLAAPPVTPHTRRRRCGGHRRARRARLRCPWAAAGPGRTTSRRARPRTAIQRRRCGGRRRVRMDRLRCPWAAAGPGRATSRRAERSSRRGRRVGGPIRINHHDPAGVEGAGGTGGPGRASRRGAERSEVAQPRGRPGPPAPGTPAAPQATTTRLQRPRRAARAGPGRGSG